MGLEGLISRLSQPVKAVPFAFAMRARLHRTRLTEKLRAMVATGALCDFDVDCARKQMGRFSLSCYTARKAAVDACPVNYKEVLKSSDVDGWQAAMRLEINLFDKFRVYDIVDRPDGVNVISSRWVYARKVDECGKLLRLKARLCARGFSQVPGEDFGETFAPTGTLRVLRAMLAEASGRSDITTHQWDCTSAFLHSDIDGDLYNGASGWDFNSRRQSLEAAEGCIWP